MLPAVVEAAQSGVPLVVVSGDRPFELRDSGANQTIDQVKIFGGYVRWQCDLGAPTKEVPLRTVVTTVDQAVRMAQGENPGERRRKRAERAGGRGMWGHRWDREGGGLGERGIGHLIPSGS